MKPIIKISILIFLTSCLTEKENDLFILSGIVRSEANYMLFGKDTIRIDNGEFKDTIQLKTNLYEYIQLNNWKKPLLIYAQKNKSISIDFTLPELKAEDDILNTFLLNTDSLLIPYSLKWDMEEDSFRTTLKNELSINFVKIDSFFSKSTVSDKKIRELKDLEKLKVAHRTANFISYQENKGLTIHRNIYDFIKDVDLNNVLFEKQLNNRNFQYYYLLDKVNEELPDSIYPFAVIDTVNKYSNIESIRDMIISSVTKSSFYNEQVNHEQLLETYEKNFGKLEKDDELILVFNQIEALKPGNPAPSIGELVDSNGQKVTIDDLNNKNILITTWGTWCPYCKEELVYIKELIRKYGDKFTSVGISLDRDESKWKEYIKESDWIGIHLIDSKRNSIFKSNYLVNGTNIHILVDRNGFIISKRGVKPSTEELENLIKLLN